jgi:hypothetical protein
MCRSASALAVLCMLAAACGAPGAAPRHGAAKQATRLSSSGAVARPGHPAVPRSGAAGPGPAQVASYRARTSRIPVAMRRHMIGVSWRPGCPVGLSRLRLLTVSYWGFDHDVHQGRLIVNESAASVLARAFGLLFAARYPIRQMQPVEAFGGNDERSMAADNTSAFNCRRVRGTSSWSMHAYGLAVDINPFENPEVIGRQVFPPAAGRWADRSRHSPAMIRRGDAVWRAFISVGWKWGGDWTSPKDYQHFSANGR